jgi:hypothetical protein
MSFQKSVSVQPAPAVAGDFSDGNPRSFVVAGPGGLVAGPNGLTIARAAWLQASNVDQDGEATIVNNTGSGPISGIVHRQQQGLITTFLADSAMSVPQGFPVSLMSEGGVWLKNEGSSQALPGQYAYAAYANGAFSFAAANAASTAAFTGGIAAGTASFTASISGDQMTVTGTVTGTIYPGSPISGSGVASGNSIVSQISGTTGGDGVYAVSIPEESVASTTITASYGLLTVSAVSSGALGVGDAVTTGASAGTVVTALGTGSGATGTYVVNNTQTVTSGTSMACGTNVQTKFFAMTSGLPGELVKVSSHQLG